MYTLEILGVRKKIFHAFGIVHTFFVKFYIQIATLKAIWLLISFYQSLLILKRKILFQILSPIIALYLLFRRKFSISWVSVCSIVYLQFLKSYPDHLFIFCCKFQLNPQFDLFHSDTIIIVSSAQMFSIFISKANPGVEIRGNFLTTHK